MVRLGTVPLILAVINFAEASSILAANCEGVDLKVRLECESRFQSRLLRENETLFERDELGLWLKSTISGRFSRHLPDFPNAAKADLYYQEFRIVAHDPDNLITHLRMYGDENFESYVYDHKYGAFEEVFWNIEISPDGKTLIGFNEDLLLGFSKNAIALYSIEEHWGLKPQASYHPETFGARSAGFIGEGKIELETYCFRDDDSAVPPQKGKAVLRYKNSVWQFETIQCGN